MQLEFFEGPFDLSQIDKDFKHSIRRLIRNDKDTRTPSILNFIYSYGVKIIQENKEDKFLKIAIQRNRNCDMKANQQNIFAMMIEVYVRPYVDKSTEYKLSRGQRSLYSRSLAYAAEHKIVANWLHPFLKEAGGYEKAALKYDQKFRESWVTEKATFV